MGSRSSLAASTSPLPTGTLRLDDGRVRLPALRNCLNGDGERNAMILDAINRRGKTIRCKVTCTPLHGPDDEVRGAILLMEKSGDDGA